MDPDVRQEKDSALPGWVLPADAVQMSANWQEAAEYEELQPQPSIGGSELQPAGSDCTSAASRPQPQGNAAEAPVGPSAEQRRVDAVSEPTGVALPGLTRSDGQPVSSLATGHSAPLPTGAGCAAANCCWQVQNV